MLLYNYYIISEPLSSGNKLTMEPVLKDTKNPVLQPKKHGHAELYL